MNPLDEQLEAVLAMIKAAGGHASITLNAPDFVKRAFLQMVLECPDCREAVMGKHGGRQN